MVHYPWTGISLLDFISERTIYFSQQLPEAGRVLEALAREGTGMQRPCWGLRPQHSQGRAPQTGSSH